MNRQLGYLGYLERIINNNAVNYIICKNNFAKSFLFGANLCYILENDNYHHIPVSVLFPVCYSGYNIYSNRNYILRKIKEY